MWLGNDGGIYYIRQTGAEIVWFGHECANAGVCQMSLLDMCRNAVFGGEWADVPYGRVVGSVSLTFRIEGDRA